MWRRWLLRALAFLLAPLVVPVVWLRPKTRPGLAARLGWHNVGNASPGPRVWLHAASAGDIKNAWPVARVIRQQRPGLPLDVTVVTNSGADMIKTLDPPPDRSSFLPLDAPGPVARTLAALKPSLVLLECTELWPVLVDELHTRQIPVAIINGRLSARSLSRYRKVFGFIPNVAEKLARVCAQTAADAERWRALGVPGDRVVVTGNCKFDAAARVPSVEKVEALRASVGGDGFIVAGSTHAGEEDVILGAFAASGASAKGERLLWAPRYLEHVDTLVQQSTARGLKVAKLSQGSQACAAAQVVVLDSMGQLAAAYALGKVAMVGGSWVPRGGQNILEPAAQKLPVLHGPQMFLSQDQADALDGHGALNVDAAGLSGALRTWLDDREAARATGEKGHAQVQSLAGAAQRHWDVLKELV